MTDSLKEFDDGIEVSSDYGNSHYNWEGFEGYNVRDNFLYLKLKDNRIIIVDQNDIVEEERKELVELVSKHCEKL